MRSKWLRARTLNVVVNGNQYFMGKFSGFLNRFNFFKFWKYEIENAQDLNTPKYPNLTCQKILQFQLSIA